MNYEDIVELSKRLPQNKIISNINAKYQQYQLNLAASKERKIVQIDGHAFLKKSTSKETLDRIQTITQRKKVGNIYEDIEDIVDRTLSDDDDTNDRLQNLNHAQDEEQYIESERRQLKKKIRQEENEEQQRLMELERLEKLKKELEQKDIEFKCTCKKIGTKITTQCEFCKEVKRLSAVI